MKTCWPGAIAARATRRKTGGRPASMTTTGSQFGAHEWFAGAAAAKRPHPTLSSPSSSGACRHRFASETPNSFDSKAAAWRARRRASPPQYEAARAAAALNASRRSGP